MGYVRYLAYIQIVFSSIRDGFKIVMGLYVTLRNVIGFMTASKKGFLMVQVGEYGIKETTEVIDLGMAIISAYFQAKQDGTIDFNDVGYLMPAFMAFPDAISDIGDIVPEMKDLQEEELFALRDHVMQKWSTIPGIDQNWTKLIAASFKIGEGIYEGIQVVGEMRK